MRPIDRVLVAAVLALPCACASTPEPVRTVRGSSFSAPGQSFESSYAPRAHGMGASQLVIDADLVVRPDTVCVPVAISADAPDEPLAMKLVEDASNAMLAAGGTGARIRVDDIAASTSRVYDANAADGTALRSSVQMRGVIEVDLPNDTPWARAKVVAALHRALITKAAPPAPSKSSADGDEPPHATIGVGMPEPGVKDLEVHRPKLLEGWSARVKAVVGAAQVDGGALELQGCSPPSRVQIVAGTLEKVGLVLPVTCTFTVSKK